MENLTGHKDYYRNYFLSAIYSHEESKIYSALKAISNSMLIEAIPLLDLVTSNDSLSIELRLYAQQIKKVLESNELVS